MIDNQGKGLLHDDESRILWSDVLKGLTQGGEEEVAGKLVQGAHPAPGQWDGEMPAAQARPAAAVLRCLFARADAMLYAWPGVSTPASACARVGVNVPPAAAAAVDGPWASAVRRREASRARCNEAARAAASLRAEAERAAAAAEGALRAKEAALAGGVAGGDLSAAVAAARETARLDAAAAAAQARAREADVRLSEAEAVLRRRRQEAAAAAAGARETLGVGLSRALRVHCAVVTAAARGSAACPSIELLPPLEVPLAQRVRAGGPVEPAGPRIRLWSRPKAVANKDGARESEPRIFYSLDGSAPSRQVPPTFPHRAPRPFLAPHRCQPPLAVSPPPSRASLLSTPPPSGGCGGSLYAACMPCLRRGRWRWNCASAAACDVARGMQRRPQAAPCTQRNQCR
jgi:hypothetical protein